MVEIRKKNCCHVEVFIEVVLEVEELDVTILRDNLKHNLEDSPGNNQLYKLSTLLHLLLKQTLLLWSKGKNTYCLK